MKVTSDFLAASKLFLLMVLPRSARAADGEALKTEKKAAICALNTELAKLPKQVAAALTNLLLREKKMQEEELKLQIYVQQNLESRKMMLPLLAAFADKRRSKITDLGNIATAALKIAGTSAFLNGHLSEFMTIAAQSGNNGASNVGCIAKDGSNTIDAVTGLGSCGLTQETIDGTGSGKQTLITATGFAALGTSKGSTGATASTTKCALFDADNSGGMANAAKTAGNLAYAAGYLTVTANSATATYKDLTGWSATNTKDAPEPYTKHYHAVNEPTAEQLYAEERPTDLTLSEVQESAQARRLYHMLTTGETTEYKETDAGAAIKSAMEQTYGDASKFKSQTWEQIGRAEVYKDPYATGSKEDTQLSTISDVNTLRVNLAYYTAKSQAVAVKRIERLQQELKADQSLQKSCDTYKTNQTCTKANCHWTSSTEDKGDHCKPKEGVKQKSQGTGEGAVEEAKKEEKCKGKLEPECTKAIECKWEGETCKESSFLVTKKFPLLLPL